MGPEKDEDTERGEEDEPRLEAMEEKLWSWRELGTVSNSLWLEAEHCEQTWKAIWSASKNLTNLENRLVRKAICAPVW